MSSGVIWAVIGLALIIAEIFTTMFVLVFFGVSALIVSLLTFIGVDNLAVDLVLFAVIGVAALLLLRGRLMSKMHTKNPPSMDSQQRIVLTGDLPAGGATQISYQGTTWTAYNESKRDFKSGERAMIARIDGVKIILTEDVL